MVNDKIIAKLEALKAQRADFLKQAEQQLAFLNGQIAALEELIQPEDPNESEG